MEDYISKQIRKIQRQDGDEATSLVSRRLDDTANGAYRAARKSRWLDGDEGRSVESYFWEFLDYP